MRADDVMGQHLEVRAALPEHNTSVAFYQQQAVTAVESRSQCPLASLAGMRNLLS
jgi:hypothetical protein